MDIFFGDCVALGGASLCLITSGCSYKILLVIWDVVLIIHADNVGTRVIQRRRSNAYPTGFTLTLTGN